MIPRTAPGAPKPKGGTERVNVKASGITWRRKPRRPRRRGSPGRTAPGRHTALLLEAVLSYRQANRPPGGEDHGKARDLECGPGRDGPAGSWMQAGIGLPYVPRCQPAGMMRRFPCLRFRPRRPSAPTGTPGFAGGWRNCWRQEIRSRWRSGRWRPRRGCPSGPPGGGWKRPVASPASALTGQRPHRKRRP